jgi:hypothetical protein
MLGLALDTAGDTADDTLAARRHLLARLEIEASAGGAAHAAMAAAGTASRAAKPHRAAKSEDWRRRPTKRVIEDSWTTFIRQRARNMATGSMARRPAQGL